MQLSPQAFNAHLKNIGQDFYYRKAYACPCISAASGAADPACPLCDGKGRTWAKEVPGRAGMTNQNQKKGFEAFGTWEPGDAVLTIGSDSPLYGAGQYDRFRAKNSTQVFSVTMVRGDRDKLLGTIKSIDRVIWLNDARTAVVEGSIPVVGGDGSMTFGGAAPPDGRAFSVTGVKYDEFFCYTALPSNRMEHAGALLPKKLAVRRYDLFGR